MIAISLFLWRSHAMKYVRTVLTRCQAPSEHSVREGTYPVVAQRGSPEARLSVSKHSTIICKALHLTAAHSSTLAWKIPWTEEPGGLQSMGSLRVGHNWATSLSLFTFMHWRRKWQPTPVFLPGESQGRGAWWAAIYGVAQSRTRLKQLSSSSSRYLLTSYVCIPVPYNEKDIFFGC